MQFETTVPTIRDRVVQTAVKLVLEPIFEADFDDSAYGYRPKRSAQDAVRVVHEAMNSSKDLFMALPAERLTDFAEFPPPAVFARAMRLSAMQDARSITTPSPALPAMMLPEARM